MLIAANSVFTLCAAVGMAANILTFFIIENKRVGRWGLLFTGVTTMTVCMLGIALVDTISKSNVSKAGGSMYVVFLAIFSAASSLGPGVAGQSALILSSLGLHSELSTDACFVWTDPGWAYAGESGSARLRAKTTTLGTVGNALVGLLMTSVLPYILDKDQANCPSLLFSTSSFFD